MIGQWCIQSQYASRSELKLVQDQKLKVVELMFCMSGVLVPGGWLYHVPDVVVARTVAAISSESPRPAIGPRYFRLRILSPFGLAMWVELNFQAIGIRPPSPGAVWCVAADAVEADIVAQSSGPVVRTLGITVGANRARFLRVESLEMRPLWGESTRSAFPAQLDESRKRRLACGTAGRCALSGGPPPTRGVCARAGLHLNGVEPSLERLWRAGSEVGSPPRDDSTGSARRRVATLCGEQPQILADRVPQTPLRRAAWQDPDRRSRGLRRELFPEA